MIIDYGLGAAELANRLRPLVLDSCDGPPPNRFGSSCLNGTPMIPLHRSTVSAVYECLERLAKIEGEKTDRFKEYGR